MSINKAIKTSFFFATTVLLAACSADQETMLSKKWKTTSIENSTVNKQINQYKQLMDTLTAQNEMIEYFGTVDSFKKVLAEDLAGIAENQKMNIENSFMEFNKNHVAYFISVDGIDSAKWSIQENELLLDPEEFTGTQEITRFKIDKLTDDVLTLRMILQTDTSIISLKKAPK